MNYFGFYIGTYFMTLAITFIITRFFNWVIYKLIYREKINRKNVVVYSFLAALVAIFIIKIPHLVINDPRFIYVDIPCLCVWFFYDYVRLSRKEKLSKRKGRTP
jgi:ABC-type Co2+ transport system permease subunit